MKKKELLIILSLIFVIMEVFLYPNFAPAAYPEKPVTLIVGFSAGGATDIVARKVTESMKKYFPQPIVVVNRPGAGGALATAETIQARPDGYTIALSTMSSLTIEPHRITLPYNTPDSYTPIVMVHSSAFYLLVKVDAVWNTLRDFLEYARANPGKVRVAHSGVGHISHLILEELKNQAKIALIPVPFPGGPEGVAAVLGRHAEGVLLTAEGALPQVQGKKLKLLAVCDENRNPVFPETPTLRESGYDITMTTYGVILGPKGLPVDVVSKLQEAYKKVSRDPDFLEYFTKAGVSIHYEDSEGIAKRLWKDYNLMGKLLENLGLKKK